MKRLFTLFLIGASIVGAQAQEDWGRKFEQLGTEVPTPNSYRTGSGAPGKDYWQQKVDYTMKVTLNDDNQSITGSETITYTNNAPDALKYLWVQLDQNVREPESNTPKAASRSLSRDSIPAKFAVGMMGGSDYVGGYKIAKVADSNGKSLPYVINKTMMRVDLPAPVKPGSSYTFSIDWSYNVNDRMQYGGRSGYEFFPEDGNYVYTIAQFFPRMAVYDDVNGWQNKQFLGSGEFALEFGDYKVDITVPEDHIISSTGWLQNMEEVLTKDQKSRFESAKSSFDKPVFVVTEEEAIENEKTKSKGTKTWTFHADNVRDFAFASSRKFIWDAQAVKVGGRTPLAMSFYPKEGNPLWAKESTKAVVNTLITYSKYTIDYPYPVAQSVHGASIGMEYPMICFNFGRPNKDGTYSDRTKYRMIGVIIHEVGHNFFPMIINSDERQWTWMDEGLNTFVQYRTQEEQYENFPQRRGTPESIVPYMKGDKKYIRPIMTNSEQVLQFGNNAYAKPATALNILRETVMGPELFDKAFKEYATRWAFKRPMPADFFRTMEDASAVDLDWYWKGWFYGVDHVDITVSDVQWFRLKRIEGDKDSQIVTAKKGDLKSNNTEGVKDFSDGYKEITLTDTDARYYGEYLNRVDDNEIRKKLYNKHFYQVSFDNKGGLVMPLIVEFTFKDGSKAVERIPAEIWRKSEGNVSKIFGFEKEVVKIVLDPNKETADTDLSNNYFPRAEDTSNFDKFKKGK